MILLVSALHSSQFWNIVLRIYVCNTCNLGTSYAHNLILSVSLLLVIGWHLPSCWPTYSSSYLSVCVFSVILPSCNCLIPRLSDLSLSSFEVTCDYLWSSRLCITMQCGVMVGQQILSTDDQDTIQEQRWSINELATKSLMFQPHPFPSLLISLPHSPFLSLPLQKLKGHFALDTACIVFWLNDQQATPRALTKAWSSMHKVWVAGVYL